MSTRTTQRPHVVIGSVDFPGDMSADIVSEVTILQSLTICSYAYTWSGTSPDGEISVQVSNDYSVDAQGNVLNQGSWDDLPLNLNGSVVSSIPVTGDSGVGSIDIDVTGFYAIRTVYTFSSGTGDLSAIIVGKVA